MADANKSIQVTIDVILDKAKAALGDLASSTQQAANVLGKVGTSASAGGASIDAIAASSKVGAASLDTLGKTSKSATDTISKGLTGTGAVSKSFFSGLALDVAKGTAAYDLFQKGVSAVTGFLEDSIKESLTSGAAWAQVKSDVTNAGLSFDAIQPKLKAYSQQMQMLGFDDDDVAQSVARLTVVTGSYSDGLKLNQLAMDLARSKQIDLATATNLVTQVTQGHGRVLQQYGITLDETASAADNLAKLNDKVTGSAERFADTTAGKVAIVQQQFKDIEKTVGNDLQPALDTLYSTTEQNLPALEQGLGGVAVAIDKIIGVIAVGLNDIKGMYDLIEAGATTAMAGVAHGAGLLETGLEKLGITTKGVGAATFALGDGLQSNVKDDLNKAADAGAGVSTAFDTLTGSATDAAAAAGDTGDALNKAGDAAGKNKPNFDGIGSGAAAAAQSMKDLSDALTTVTQKQQAFSFESSADFGNFAKLLENTTMSQDEWVKEAEQGFDAMGTSIKSLGSDIDNINSKITDAQKSFTDFVKSSNQSSGDDFAKIVYDAKQAVMDLPNQIATASAAGQDTNDLQKKLNDARDSIRESQKSQYQDNTEFQAELKELQKEGDENSLAAAYDASQKKIADKKAETDAAIAELKKQADAEEQERAAFVSAQAEMTTAFQQNIAIRQKSGTGEIASLDDLTKAVNAAAASYNSLGAAAQAAAAASAYSAFTITANTTTTSKIAVGTRASGGPVTADQSYLVGENGPEIFTPNQSGNVNNDPSKGSGSGSPVNITINNPQVRSDDDLKDLVAQIMTAMSRRDQLAKMGAYK